MQELMLEDVREAGVQSSRATSFSETGGRGVRMGVDAGKLVGSWRSFCLIALFFSLKEEARHWLRVKGVVETSPR